MRKALVARFKGRITPQCSIIVRDRPQRSQDMSNNMPKVQVTAATISK